MNCFDANTWVGRWPFAFLPAHTPQSLATHLRRHGITRALTSPVDALLAPSPRPANAALLRSTRGLAALTPVPVINPALADWREQLAEVTADPRVRAVRFLPNYHGYRLGSRAVTACADELQRRRLRLIVQVRVIDERHEFHAMRLKGVPVAALDEFLRRHPRLPVLACGLTRNELFKLSPSHSRLLMDLSFVEWHDTLRDALTRTPARQLVLGTHTPFFITAASRAKVATANVPARTAALVAGGNLRRFLSL